MDLIPILASNSGPQPLTMMQTPLAPQPSLSQTIIAAAPLGARRGSDLRLRKHADYQRVYKATRKQFSSSMSWFLAVRSSLPESTASSPSPRVGLTAGKVLGKAHERNLIKRRMREAVRHAIHELPEGIDLILHPKRSVMTMDFVKLEAEVLRIFRQATAQTREITAKAAQGKPVLGPEAAQNSGQNSTMRKALGSSKGKSPGKTPGQIPARTPGKTLTRS